MMKNALTLICLLTYFVSFGQDNFKELEAKHNFVPVLEMGSMPGGEKMIWPKYIDGKPGLDSYIAKHIKYPEMAVKEKMDGTVVLSYSISTTGKVVDVVFSEGDANELLQKELIRVVANSGPWIPGKRGEKYIKMKLAVSYDFKLP
jgi:protein TonB